jgi:hypothetical protein
MRVMDLPNWPPDASGAVDPRKMRFAISSQEVLIDAVTSVNGKQITFVCKLDGDPHKYFFTAPDEKTAAKLKTILEKNVGMTLYSVGLIEIPPDPA